MDGLVILIINTIPLRTHTSFVIWCAGMLGTVPFNEKFSIRIFPITSESFVHNDCTRIAEWDWMDVLNWKYYKPKEMKEIAGKL